MKILNNQSNYEHETISLFRSLIHIKRYKLSLWNHHKVPNHKPYLNKTNKSETAQNKNHPEKTINKTRLNLLKSKTKQA